MKLLVHVVRADLRQFRWAILLWLVLVAAETVLTAIRPAFLDDLRAYGHLGMILSLLSFALLVTMLLMVPLIVQAHPAVGTDAFWMTRPMPPLTLFASKIVLLATLMVLVPCAARLALMLWIHVPVREASFVVLDTAITRAAWLALIVTGAVVTLNLPRFALLCGAVFASFVLFITILIMWPEGTDQPAMLAVGPPVLPPTEDPTNGILFLLVAIAAGLALTAIQYRTRLRRVSVPAGVGGFVLLAFAIPYWPFPLLRVPSSLPAWSRDPTAAQLHAASPVIEMSLANPWAFERVPALRNGATRVSVSRVPPGWVPRLMLVGASMTLTNSVTIISRGRGYQSTPELEGSSEDPSRVVARQVLGVERVLASAPRLSEMVTALVLPANEIDPMMPATGRYRGHFAVYLAHWEAAAALPLRPGAVFDDYHYRFAIEHVHMGPDQQLAVRAREWRATSSFDRKPQITYAFYVRNAQHSHAMVGNASEPFAEFGATSGWVPFFGFAREGSAAFFARGALVSFPPSHGLQEQKIDWDPAWYADAELVIVRITEAGAVLRTLEMPQASLAAKQ